MALNAYWWQTYLSISETADLLGFSHITISTLYKELFQKHKLSSERQFSRGKCHVDARGLRRMADFKLSRKLCAIR